MKPPLIPPVSAFSRGSSQPAPKPAAMRAGGPVTATFRPQASRPAAFASPTGAGGVHAAAVPAPVATTTRAPQQPGGRPPIRPAPPGSSHASRAANAGVGSPQFALQTPMAIAGGHQRISMTIKGSQRVVGSVDVRPSGSGTVHISNLRVEKQYRRQGVASQLMNAAFSNARTHGYSGVRLEAMPSDTGISRQALVTMYQRMGFRSTGRLSRGGHVMERHL